MKLIRALLSLVPYALVTLIASVLGNFGFLRAANWLLKIQWHIINWGSSGKLSQDEAAKEKSNG